MLVAINKSIRTYSAPTELESTFKRVVYKHSVPPDLKHYVRRIGAYYA